MKKNIVHITLILGITFLTNSSHSGNCSGSQVSSCDKASSPCSAYMPSTSGCTQNTYTVGCWNCGDDCPTSGNCVLGTDGCHSCSFPKANSYTCSGIQCGQDSSGGCSDSQGSCTYQSSSN